MLALLIANVICCVREYYTSTSTCFSHDAISAFVYFRGKNENDPLYSYTWATVFLRMPECCRSIITLRCPLFLPCEVIERLGGRLRLLIVDPWILGKRKQWNKGTHKHLVCMGHFQFWNDFGSVCRFLSADKTIKQANEWAITHNNNNNICSFYYE